MCSIGVFKKRGMAHGPDTEELLRLIANVQNGILNVCELNITSLPELPSELQYLFCNSIQITTLPTLPSKLKELYCSRTPITSLPDLPSGLETLYCHNTPITSLPALPSELKKIYCSRTSLKCLPDLPSGLQMLNCSHTSLTSLPDLPSGLKDLYCSNTPHILQPKENESIQDYNLRYREEKAAKKRAQERSAAIKEELVAVVWAPKRVEKWLETGGFELLEAL